MPEYALNTYSGIRAMKDRTITRRVARYRKKLALDRGWKRVEVFVPAGRAADVKSYAAYLRGAAQAPDDPARVAALRPFFEGLVAKYLWWKEPVDGAKSPERVALQVMDIGDYEDVQRLVRLAGNAVLRHALQSSEAGQLSPRSWTYWNYRLGLVEAGNVPALPTRRVS